jgi:hypothetical protein
MAETTRTGECDDAENRREAASVKNYLVSLPERVVRVAAAGAGGFLYEASQVVLPSSVRRSRLYQATVARGLRLLVELLGGVSGVFRQEPLSARNLAMRKLAGNAVELTGFLAMGWSPVWLLAAAADLTNGTRVYLRAMVDELKRAGVLAESVNVATVEDLLAGLEKTSGTAADTIDVLPLNLADLRASWRAMRQHVAALPDAAALAQLFAALQQTAQREQRSLLSVSSAVALGAMHAGIQVGNTYLFEYYRQALRSIREEGFATYLQRVSRPYAEATARHLDPREPTYTGRLVDRWRQRTGAPPGQDPSPD